MNPVFHSRTKHIDIRIHFIREALQDKKVELQHLSTDRMIADLLTKAVPKPKVEFCVKGLGLTQSE